MTSQPVDRDARMALAREWDELVSRVEEKSDSGSFFRPLSARRIVDCGASGPVIVLNCGPNRCDAIITSHNKVMTLQLPTDRPTVFEQTELYLQAIYSYEAAASRFDLEVSMVADATGLTHLQKRRATDAKREYELARVDFEQRLLTVLEWLWADIVKPILDHIGLTSSPKGGEWPRIWWCPAGAFSLLPLHAAGLHESGNDSACDRAAHSYTPSLRALLKARSSIGFEASARLLVVDVSQPADRGLLPGARQEARYLINALGSSSVTLLEGDSATRSSVSEQLRTHRWVHFSCHAEQNLDTPSESRLHLGDGDLTVIDISANSYHGEFVFLAACETASTGVSLADESITLAAGLHYSGFQHVVASTWKIRDSASQRLVESFYDKIRDRTTLNVATVPFALHTATRELRNIQPSAPSTWMPFTHTGP